MMSAVIETEERMGEGETKRERERERRKERWKKDRLNRERCQPPIVVHRDFRGLGILFYAGSRKRL